MKNKFKKSKIIVPALALITATTVASVTGTVAWFTANRTATLTASEFQAKALNSTLKIKAEAINGCALTSGGDGTTDKGTLTVSGPLTHASFNADGTTKNVFTALSGDNQVSGYKEIGAYTETSSSNLNVAGSDGDKSVYYVVSWKLTFKQDLSSTSEKLAVLFNPAASFYSDATGVNAGFKTAMYCGNQIIVFGNDGVKTHVKSEGKGTTSYEKTGDQTIDQTKTYYTAIYKKVSSPSTESISNYYEISNGVYVKTSDATVQSTKTYYTKEEGYEIVNTPDVNQILNYYEKKIDLSSMEESFDDKNYMQHQASYQTLNDEDNTLISAIEYLGTIDSINSSGGLVVNCVSWYEGTDSAVVTDNINNAKIASSLSFYSRRIKAN